jgi:arylsulfatase A-like enzyme
MRFLLFGSAFASLALALFSIGPLAAAEPHRPPNILLIISDDQGWRDYSFMGHRHLRTASIDRLATQSLTFSRGYVPCSLCCPSLASLITGRYPHQHRIVSNDPPLPPGLRGAAVNADPGYRAARREMIGFIDKVPTLPRLLGQKDYVSFQTGKWWQGHFRHGGFTDGMSHGAPERGGRHGDEGLKIGRQTMQPIYDFIDQARRGGKPFFVWYAPMMPHQPHNPPQRLLAKYKDKAPTLPLAKYWAMCEWFDETCGQLLDHLDRRGLTDQTLVVYLADNGWIQKAKEEGYAAKSKQSPYDGGLRTPLLIRWPGRVKPRRSDNLATSIDIAPTLLAAAGLKPDKDMPGLNLLDDEAVKARQAIFGECFTHNAVDIHDPASSLRYRWMIEGSWKLIVPAGRNQETGAPELYDLAHDPDEERNRAAEEKATVERLKMRLDAWWTGQPVR